MDADPKHRELVTLMRIGTGGQSYAEKNNAMQPQSVSGAAASAAVPEKSAGRRDYTDAELLAKGYSRKEISEARQYIADFDALPAGQRAARRAANTIGGIGDTVASSVFLAGETGVQSAKNAAATSSNWKQLQQDVQSDDRQQELLRLMTGGKTRYAARDNTLQLAQSSGAMASAPAAQTTQSDAYTDAELIEKGYTQQEIDNMRARIAGTEVHDSVDPEKSFGYQLYKRGQDLTAAAQAGLSPIAKQALGIVSSAGENLAVAAIDPAWVLPVLSAQGGAEAMGQSVEKGESAGKTLAGGLAKFGAGWAINSVGAADLAKTMGSDYAKNTLAGKLADMVRSVAADGTLAQRYPAVANAISGGVDNAMQAFVETYADKAIDATLGDSETAADLFKSDTFLTALESGLTGGASGALGGAVGTGLAKANGGDASIVGNVKRAYYEGQMERARQALQDEVRAQEPGTAMQQTPEEAAAGTRQPAAATQETVQPEVTGTTSGFATMQDTAPMVQSENPAVQQLAAAVQDGQLTSKTINLFTPNAANEANRAAFAEEYGVELPETEAKTRQVLREMTTQQRAAQAPATATENATVEAQNTAAIVEKMEADRSARQAQTESELGRSGAAVENTGERVESSPAEQSGGMRETYGLEQQSLTTKQREVQHELTRWQVSDGASATISRNMPTEIGDAGRYAAAASSLYRLGQMEDVHTFDKAMELAQGMSGLAVNTDYVLAQDGGREALQLAWLQGHGELEAGKMQRASLGGRLTAESTSGSGRVLYKGTMRTANEVGTQLIELNAKATNTDAVLKTVLQGSDRVRAYVDTETARIFFSDRAEDVFGTILHEDYHWYNSLDAEGAQALQQHALEFLAKSEGFEGIDEMIRGKLSDYAQQGLSYEEAAEELVADAWRGIFSDEASFKRWVEFQRGQAEKNAGKAGSIHKVMTKVKELLSDIVSRAKEVLARDPENKAALKAQRLAVAEKRVLQDEYFAHAERAMDSLRAAKENAAALENKGAAEGTRFEIKKDAEGETYIQIDEDILKGIPQENWKSVVKQAIRERFPDGFVRNGWTILNSKDAKLYNKGDIEQAYQKGQTVHLGMLTDADGTPTADSILQTVEAAMTDYDRAWCADMKEFFDNYTTKLINETSLQLVGYQRATVKNYYPIAVDKSVLATQIDGLNLDATIEGRGFLKNRVKSGQPVLLEECANVVQRSLRDTAAYAGLAAPIRDVQKILNSGVETRERLANLKNGIIKEQWGKDAVSYIDDLLTDLQTTQRKRPSTFNKVLGNLRGNYAGAVLTLNPGVAIAQAASLPTAAAVLGGDTMAAVVPFVKNLSPKARTALETEIKEHGDVLLDWRKRGSQNGELASIGKQETLAEKGMDKLPNWLTGWINGMDEVTVAALWEGSKRYVQNHTAEFEGAEVTGSPAYWEAVNRTYQKVIEQTQPNYTVMQRAGIQRNPNELLKQLTMFTTQRFQNYGILADAIGDYRAQAERYRQNQSDENKAELQRAKTQRNRAVVSQAAQTAVFAIMKIGADFLLHRWDREQDENGDVTVKSMWKRFASLYTESFAGNFLYGSELYSLIDNAVNGKDYDVLSAASISVVNDLAGDVQKFFAEFRKDTSEMDEEQLQKHHNKLMQRSMTLLEDSFEVAGVPYGNGRKIVEAVKGYYGDLENLAHGGQFSFNSVPQSATGQYDRLYNAYAGGDSDEAKAAVEKLNAMVEAGTIAENKMYSQLKSRLVKYDVRVRQAAEEQNAGNDQKRYELENEMIEQLSEVLGLPKGKRGDVVDCVTGAVNQLAETQLKGDNASATDDLVEAVDSWDAGAVQEEYDRLAKAGKSATTLKSKITETAKPEYLAGSDADRQQMEEMLLALKDADGKELYTEKNFAQWVKEAEKKAEEGPEPDPYAAVR